MSDLVLIRRFTADYLRNGSNVLVLAVVPMVFVVVAAPALAGAAEVLGGANAAAVQDVTPAWAAAFLTAVAMYFQVATARGADARLAQAGYPAGRVVAARIGTGLLIAVSVSTVALAALVLRTGAGVGARTVLGTVSFAVIYLGVGTAVGATVRTPVNGTVLILFVWILDIFFGPSMSPAQQPVLRLMPTHLASVWVLDLDADHAGTIGNGGGMVAWVLLSLAAAAALLLRTVGTGRHRSRSWDRPGSRFSASLRAGMLGLGRTPLLWTLLLVVPVVFITLAKAVTPAGTTLVTVVEGGRTQLRTYDPARIHGALMAPIAVASLAALVGLFLAIDDRPTDRRLALAGGGRLAIVGSRLLIVVLAAAGVTGVALAVSGAQFTPGRWSSYALGNVLVAVTYGLVGVLIGPILGRVSGVFVAFLAPFLDIGISQSPMLRATPDRWAELLPGYGGVRVAVDGALTNGFDQATALAGAGVWVIALALLAAFVLVRGMPAPRTTKQLSAQIAPAGVAG